MRKVSALDRRNRIEFKSKALAADCFTVINFSGHEALSNVYRFEIELVSEQADIGLDSVLAQGASLRIVQGDHTTQYNGVLAEFEELHQKEGDTFYRAVLVPRLWQLSLYRVNEVYVDKSTPDVIRKVLEEAGFTSLDYEFSLTGKYTPWTHLCEYAESHLDFISRLMERDGLYYYFVQDDSREKLVITDTGKRHEVIPGAGQVFYEPASGLRPDPEKQVLSALICRQKPLPKKLVVMDYNYRKPSLELKTEVVVDANGRGDVYLYGEHADDQAESRQLAEIRAQELRCRKRTFHGESSVSLLRSGYLAEVAGHFRPDFNQRYLLVEVSHEGSQAGMVLHANTGSPSVGDQSGFYRNSFSAIAADVQFRPQRVTAKPRIHGAMNAVIDAEGSGVQPELDEHGRYKVWLPLDRAEHGDAKASQWVRMASPYAGQDHGMHFPLRKGTEVLLTFIDGDPNRPIIAGAVPNMDTPNVVNRDNLKNSVMRVVGGMETYIGGARSKFVSVGARASDDTDVFGQNAWEKAYGWDADCRNSMATEANKTVVFDNTITHNKMDSINRTLGNTTEETRGNSTSLTFGNSNEETHGNSTSKTWGNSSEETVGNSTSKTTGNSSEETRGNSSSRTWGNSTEETYGDTNSLMRGNSVENIWGNATSMHMGATQELFFGNATSISLSAAEEITVGLSGTFNLAATTEIFIGAKFEMTVAASLEMSAGPKTELESAGGLKFKPAFDAEVATNDIKTKVNEIATRTNLIQTNVNKIISTPVMVDTGAMHIQSKGLTLLT